MLRDNDFYMFWQLLNTIVAAYTRQEKKESASMVLFCIVTLLCRYLLDENAFNSLDNKRFYLTPTPFSASYRAARQED